MTVNKAILVGRVGADPEVKHFSADKKVARFSLATSESYRDKESGDRIENTEWHRISVFSKLADVVDKYVSKGSLLYVEGKIKTEKFKDEDGKYRYSTGIVAETIRMLSKRDNASEESPLKKQFDPTDSFVDEDIPF